MSHTPHVYRPLIKSGIGMLGMYASDADEEAVSVSAGKITGADAENKTADEKAGSVGVGKIAGADDAIVGKVAGKEMAAEADIVGADEKAHIAGAVEEAVTVGAGKIADA